MANKMGLRAILENRERDFQDRVVLDFLKNLGYNDKQITKEPECGTGYADYLVQYGTQQFFIEASSPNLSKKSLLDLKTRFHLGEFEELVKRRVSQRLPDIFQRCCLSVNYGTGASGPTLPDEVKGPQVDTIIDKVRPWKDRIDEIAEWASEEPRSYRYCEEYTEEFLQQEKIIIPYPYGSITVRKGDESYTIRWKLLRRHHRYGPRKWRCMATGGGGDATPYNLVRSITKKTKRHGKRSKGDSNVEDIPLVLFMDGRSCLHFGSAGSFFCLDRAFSDIKWQSKTPHAVVLVGAWGLPVGFPRSKELEEKTGDMIVHPRHKEYLYCLRPFLRSRVTVRLWSTITNLIPVE